ncbi:hypothetical protein X797_001245 [Metarhizium robertsii]|uniref:Uncharacterized protein n=1 Tax=Metarhizium robertsii TaxID=568076 RepID=A0A0A1V9F8_9HYPO|nr:hypothetical protein X797_001245 [Metarhizium robertsii]
MAPQRENNNRGGGKRRNTGPLDSELVNTSQRGGAQVNVKAPTPNFLGKRQCTHFVNVVNTIVRHEGMLQGLELDPGSRNPILPDRSYIAVAKMPGFV